MQCTDPMHGILQTHSDMLPVYLHFQLLQHLVLSVLTTQITQVDQRLMHGLVPSQSVSILHGLPHDVTILILNNYDFLRLSHAGYHQASQFGEDAIVQVLAGRCLHAYTRIIAGAAGLGKGCTAIALGLVFGYKARLARSGNCQGHSTNSDGVWSCVQQRKEQLCPG